MACLGFECLAFQKPSKKDYLITIETSLGEMKAILFEDTPLHRENFLQLIEKEFYDSLLFHRVINAFMIQGGDPESKGASPEQRLGNGGPGYRVDAEFRATHFHQKGAIAAARQGDRMNPEKKSSGSQFYIVQGKPVAPQELAMMQRNQLRTISEWSSTHAEHPLVVEIRKTYEEKGTAAVEAFIQQNIHQFEEAMGSIFNFPAERDSIYAELGGTPHLDGQYTVFGQVIDGLEVIDRIAAVETSQRDRPKEDVVMVISAKRMRKKKITKSYGYVYED